MRALALQGTIALNRGDLRTALALATEAEPRLGEDAVARAELAALKSQLSFFSGAYADALAHAEAAMALADEVGDLALRLFVRRAACMVLGTVGVPGWAEWLQDMLELSIAAGDGWQEAISRNDLAAGTSARAGSTRPRPRSPAASRSPGRSSAATSRSASCTPRAPTSACSRAAPSAALADAERALAYLCAAVAPQPVRLRRHRPRAGPGALRARPARRRAALRRGRARPLGEHLPHARSIVLATLADALHEAGQIEEAYEVLHRSAAAEREGLQDLAELRVSLERTRVEADAAVRPERRARGARAASSTRRTPRSSSAPPSSRRCRSSSASRPTATG